MRFKELWDTNGQAPIALFKSVHQYLKYIQLAFFTRPAISRESDILPGFASFPGFSEGWEVGGDEKNLLLCPQLLTHRPIGVGGATDEFWAPTQSGFFRTIGKGGKRAEAVLYCFCTSAYATGTLMLQRWVNFT